MTRAFHATRIPYAQTGKFTKMVLDYVAGSDGLANFYEHAVNLQGIQFAIEARKKFNTNRPLLVEQLEIQYQAIQDCGQTRDNIRALAEDNTFTVCTAHQPNIFTGHLYFIYKILHTIKLAEHLRQHFPGFRFVPVYFMGSEDADLEELNHVVVDGKKYVWHTKQTGAVGRMKVDGALLQLIEALGGRILVEPHGNELMHALKTYFQKDETIERATFLLVHHLFKKYGLVVFLPDNGAFKKAMIPVFEQDIFGNASSIIVNETDAKLASKYKVQAHPREINLFYLTGDIRNRLVLTSDGFRVHDTDIVFTAAALRQELQFHPERFSPNVILRGLFQEMLLPGIAFIGGGGEIAYWLQLKDMFHFYHVPFPMLIVRNSFLIIEKKIQQLIGKLQLSSGDLFKEEGVLFSEIVAGKTRHRLQLEEEKFQIQQAFYSIKQLVQQIDPTLEQHAQALETQSTNKLKALEAKMLRAEKRKFAEAKNQLAKITAALFPADGLQERSENFMLLYAKWGQALFDVIYQNSLTLEQQFCVIGEVS
jgi:bacillithiol biosynthesis cysteine-adding enzyme BshC